MSARWSKLVIVEHTVPTVKLWGSLVLYPRDIYGYVFTRNGVRKRVKFPGGYTCYGQSLMIVDGKYGRSRYFVDGDDFDHCIILDHTDYWGELIAKNYDNTELQRIAKDEIPWYAY